MDCMKRASETRKDRYTILNQAELSDERLGMIYENMKRPIE